MHRRGVVFGGRSWGGFFVLLHFLIFFPTKPWLVPRGKQPKLKGGFCFVLKRQLFRGKQDG